MGLNMYIFKAKKTNLVNPDADVDFDYNPNGKVNFNDRRYRNDELWYWYKENAVHNWFHQLYIKKGGADPEFNCNKLRITHTDIIRLLQDSRERKLKPISGSFFGSTDYTEEDWVKLHQDLVGMAEKIQPYLENNKLVVYYDSRW